MGGNRRMKQGAAVGTAIVPGIIALATPAWIVISQGSSGSITQGLFTVKAGGASGPVGGGGPESAAAGLFITAIILMVLSIAALIAVQSLENRLVKFVPAILCGVAGLLLIAGMGHYTAFYSKAIYSTISFGYSFYIGWVAAVATIIDAIQLCIVSD